MPSSQHLITLFSPAGPELATYSATKIEWAERETGVCLEFTNTQGQLIRTSLPFLIESTFQKR